MTMDFVAVNVLGCAAIAWIVWYFFLSRRPDATTATAVAGAQDVHVTVRGGYIPEIVHARPGLPLRIHFRREETSACSEEVVFPDFGVRRHLPALETTIVELPASAPGSYAFACGMDMMHGRVIVGDAVPTPAPAAPSTDDWPRDPICGMKVNPARPAATLLRDGRTVFFCSIGCRARFERGDGPGPMAQPITLGVRRRD